MKTSGEGAAMQSIAVEEANYRKVVGNGKWSKNRKSLGFLRLFSLYWLFFYKILEITLFTN